MNVLGVIGCDQDVYCMSKIRGIRTHIVRVEGEHSDHLATALYILRYTVGFTGVGSKPRPDPVKIS